jgi:flagellar biogenesis protein FliO
VSKIDLNNPPPNHKFSVSVEKEESPGDQKVRLFKDVGLFIVAIGFVVLIAWICYSTLMASTSSAEEKKWAMSALSAATAGLIGYLVRN